MSHEIFQVAVKTQDKMKMQKGETNMHFVSLGIFLAQITIIISRSITF